MVLEYMSFPADFHYISAIFANAEYAHQKTLGYCDVALIELQSTAPPKS